MHLWQVHSLEPAMDHDPSTYCPEAPTVYSSTFYSSLPGSTNPARDRTVQAQREDAAPMGRRYPERPVSYVANQYAAAADQGLSAAGLRSLPAGTPVRALVTAPDGQVLAAARGRLFSLGAPVAPPLVARQREG